MALTAAVASAVMVLVVFPHGSFNNDEGAYLLAGRALAHGHLFPVAPADARGAQPWFFIAHSGHYVSKYLPALPAMLALSLATTGQYWPALAFLAALLPVVCFGVARQAGLRPGQALAAAGLVSASPLVLVQSGLALSYVPFADFIGLLWYLAFRVLRTGERWTAFTAGLVLAVSGTLRPFDTVLLAAPFALALARQRAIPRLKVFAFAAAGAAPLVVLTGLYNAAATGNPFRLPFNLLEPSDKIGFGTRRIFPEDTSRSFGAGQAVHGTLLHFGAEPLVWYAAGLLVLPAVVVRLAVRRASTGPRLPLLLQSSLVFLLGYFFFWGPWNASVLFGGPRRIGPFYALALLLPLVVSAVPVLASLARRAPVLLLVVGIAAAGGNADYFVRAMRIDLRDTHRTDAVLSALHALPAGTMVVTQVDPSYGGHPVSAVGSGERPVAQTLAASIDPADIDARRRVVMLSLDSNFYGPPPRSPFQLLDEQRIAGTSLVLSAGQRIATSDILTIASRTSSVSCHGVAAITVRADGSTPLVQCSAATLPTGSRSRRLHGMQSACPTAECIDFTLWHPGAHGLSPRSVRRLVIGRDGGGLVAYVDVSATAHAPFVDVTAS